MSTNPDTATDSHEFLITHADAGELVARAATIHEAQRAVRDLILAGYHSLVVTVPTGTIYLEEPVVFTSEDSPQGAGSVTWRAAVPGHTRIFGGRRITSTWEQRQDGTHQATIAAGLDFDELFIDGQRQTLARYPNYTEGEILQGTAADALSAERVGTWSNPGEGRVRALHKYEWGGNSFRITGTEPNGEPTLDWVGDNQRGSEYDPQHVLVEGIREELDAPGEWHYDPDTGTLTIYPLPGTDLTNAIIETGELDELIVIRGERPEEPIQGIRIEGITLGRTHRTLFNSTYEPLLMGDWSVVRKAAIHLQNTRNIHLENCGFDSLGGNAVLIDGFAQDCSITHSTFRNNGASDILILGHQSAVRSASTWDNTLRTVTDRIPGPQTEDYPRDITVYGNTMSRMGRHEKQTAAVNISMAHRITVSHNTIHDGPRAGININDGTWGGHLIQGNSLWNMVQETGDHGPINAWGRDRFWPVPHDNTSTTERALAAGLDARDTTHICGNYIWHSKAWAIDLDDGSSNYRLCHNLLANSGIKLRDGFHRTAENNILVNGSIHIHQSESLNYDVVTRNIILGRYPYQFAGTPDPADAGRLTDYNAFWNNGEPMSIDIPTLDAATAGDTAAFDAHSLIANPDFRGGNPWDNPGMRDYTVMNKELISALGFEQLPTRFGAPPTNTQTDTPPPIDWEDTEQWDATSAQTEVWGAWVTDIATAEFASAVGLDTNSGAFVHTLTLGPFKSARVQPGDVIRTVDGREIRSTAELLDAASTGTPRTIEVWRNQAPVVLTA
ncbi:PDZ domain-containing protein [Haematomicrobium sanguinis]|uniref:PDZ domain-containing protein n=1 Tax=Haematomicrobium sanguinis TaxID=479106 RepID=UPI00069238F7|nr:PDZ domain-containing protein [Haematomicrobium sanguinis]